MNSYTPQFIESHKLVEIDLQFIAEALHGQKLMLRLNDSDILKHEHLISYDGKELFKMILKWDN
jgi:hypothetical protein